MKKLGIALGVLAFLLGVFRDELGTKLTVLLASVFPVSIVVYAFVTRKRSTEREQEALNLRESRPSTPEEERDAVVKIFSDVRSDLERQSPDNPTIPFLKSIIRGGAKFGGNPQILNAAVMVFIKECLDDGRSLAYVASSLGGGIEATIAESIFRCFEKYELNAATATEAEKMEQKSISQFERMAWHIVQQLSNINQMFKPCQ